MSPRGLLIVFVKVIWVTFGNLTGVFGFTPLEGLEGVGGLLVLGLLLQYVKARRQQSQWSLEDDSPPVVETRGLMEVEATRELERPAA